jgi:hypothetical protein
MGFALGVGLTGSIWVWVSGLWHGRLTLFEWLCVLLVAVVDGGVGGVSALLCSMGLMQVWRRIRLHSALLQWLAGMVLTLLGSLVSLVMGAVLGFLIYMFIFSWLLPWPDDTMPVISGAAGALSGLLSGLLMTGSMVILHRKCTSG